MFIPLIIFALLMGSGGMGVMLTPCTYLIPSLNQILFFLWNTEDFVKTSLDPTYFYCMDKI